MINKGSNKKWCLDEENKFVNPYTFIPFPRRVARKNIETYLYDNSSNLVSGRIDCTMTTITPLAMPGVLKKKNDDHPEYEFCHIGDKPVIPGSNIRGCIRNIYETITASCASKISDKNLSFRENDKKSKPGLIVKDGDKWKLFTAQRSVIPNMTPKFDENGTYIERSKDGKKYYNFQKVYFSDESREKEYIARKVTNISTRNRKLGKRGYLRIWENAKESNQSIFVKGTEVRGVVLPDSFIDDLTNLYELYETNNSDNEHAELFKNIKRNFEDKKKEDNDNYPVWFSQVGNEIYISLGQFSQRLGKNKLSDFLGSTNMCSDENNVCDACAMFGMINGDSKLSGRVRFTDAIAQNSNIIPSVTLKELASPKISATEFYTQRPSREAKVWTYDYYVREGMDRKEKKEKINPKVDFLNGRKFYWHHSDFDINDCMTTERTKRNCTVDLVDKNSVFQYSVYFDQITESELKKLLWAISLGENHGTTMCQKLGYGKPLGLGSVKIIIDNVTIKSNDYQSGVDCNAYKDVDQALEDIRESLDKKALKSLEMIANIDSLKGKTISYPIGKNQGGNEATAEGSHQWFVGNKYFYNLNDPKVKYVLRDQIDRNIIPEYPAMIKK